MATKRHFLKLSITALAASVLAPILGSRFGVIRPALAFYQSSGLRKFSQPLRGVGPAGIPVAAPDAAPAPVTGATHYTISMNQYNDQLHPDLGLTTLWGYNPAHPLGGGSQPQKHLGGIIVAQKGAPIQITFRNNLPPVHILPVDTSIMGAEGAQNRASVHLHGGLVPWISDGGPHAWFAPDGSHGPSFVNNQVLNPAAAANEAEHYYPNNQSARLVWYHDHAIGITRLSAYAGLASAYIIRDSFENGLISQGLPDYVERGGREIPIVIQDKIFVNASTIGAIDPTWTGPRATGSLWYPHSYDPTRWDLDTTKPAPPTVSVIPEMFGDTMLANGLVYPEATVEARRYRLRILNACQARFLNLQLYVDNATADGITLVDGNPTNAAGPSFLVLGTEGGFLSKPVVVPSNVPFNQLTLGGSLITAPAERWDLLVDFTGFAGQKIILYNDAPAPFPNGDSRDDYYPGAPDNATVTTPGFGPNSRQILRFNVVAATSADPPLTVTAATDLTAGIDTSLVNEWTTQPISPPAGVRVRQLTLNESSDEYGRLIQTLGTDVAVSPGSYGRAYSDPTTETVKAASVEVWQIANLTGDTHPIHFHLANVQILSRQPFGTVNYGVASVFTGTIRGPEPTELGWKETVKMHPNEVTTVIMKFDLATVPFQVPASPRTGGHEFVWHCHILEHEEHDMMRPLVVEPNRLLFPLTGS